MIHASIPVSLNKGLRDLRCQMAIAFTGETPKAVLNPVRFQSVAEIGRAAKDALPRFTARP